MKADIIISRHNAFRAYVREIGLADDDTLILTHVGPHEEHLLNGKVVIGMIPHRLARRCREVIQVDLDIPRSLRGTELTLAQMRQLGATISRYRVEWLGNVDLPH